ncbi:unnamed protein product [Caenorhabditis angaria]|uniref:rRNA-processing protein UTP23 homolog n=1 Tax=Caenorhabditis angaria TaxID=860376 RepID=A0A9P1N3N4_9PELO|nr:unnamed protein product [Caenorhabditis angaria]
MKVKRIKRANRILTFFKYNYKFNAPYKVLMDGTFCNAALQEQINLAEQIPKYLTEETHLMTTNCVLEELKKFGPLLYGALVIAKKFEIAECNHKNPVKSASDCLAHLARRAASGKQKYFIATQDDELTEKLRTIVGTPVMYIKFKTVLLDNISEATKNGANSTQKDITQLKELKKQLLAPKDLDKKKKKKRKGGANPLSCKKKVMKISEVSRTGERTASGKRKRTKKKEKGSGEELA